MTFKERFYKAVWFVGITAFYVLGFFALNWWTSFRLHRHTLILPLEARIPFVPWMIFAYLFVYGFFIAAYLIIQDLNFFKKLVKTFTVVILLNFLFFLLFPVEYVLRAPVGFNNGLIESIVAFYYWLDLPYNCFPSMHVSSSFFMAFVLDRYQKGLGKFLIPLAALVAVSVVLVKQHYIADVVAGFVLAWVIFRSVWRTSPEPRSMP